MAENAGLSADVKLRLMGLALFVVFSPVAFIVAHYTRYNRGLAAECVLIVFSAVAYARRDLLKRAGFVMTLSALLIAQFAGILFVPFPEEFPGAVMLPIAFADVFFLLGISNLFGKRA